MDYGAALIGYRLPKFSVKKTLSPGLDTSEIRSESESAG